MTRPRAPRTAAEPQTGTRTPSGRRTRQRASQSFLDPERVTWLRRNGVTTAAINELREMAIEHAAAVRVLADRDLELEALKEALFGLYEAVLAYQIDERHGRIKLEQAADRAVEIVRGLYRGGKFGRPREE